MTVHRQAVYGTTHHPAHGLLGVLNRAHEMVSNWHDRVKYRRELSELDDHMLQDLGLDRQTVDHEVHKPFWRG